MKKRITNRDLAILGGLTFFSFLLRLFTNGKEVVYPDLCLYLSFAKSILKAERPEIYRRDTASQNSGIIHRGL